jgi:diguanylate cyclase (GGDEF)-like protein
MPLADPRILAGAVALTVAGLLLLLYFYRRRLYILYWIAGWALVAASMFVAAARFAPGQAGDAVYGFSQFLGIMGGLVFVVSADAYYMRPRIPRRYAGGLLAVLIWFVLAPLALERVSVFVPGHLLIAGGLAAAGAAHFALLRQRRMLGAAVVGAMFLALAGLNVWVAFRVPEPQAPAAGVTAFVTVGLYLVTALGMQLMTFEDMTYELRMMNRRLESAQSDLREMVTTDALTGCRNRRFFDEIIGREIQRRKRYNVPLSMLFVDIDRFKAINDTLGHEAGDRVLQQVAAFLIRNVREADYVFRWGGDEFLILISCREDEARSKGADLQAAFAESVDAASLPRGIGLSVGSVEVPADTTNIMALIKIADERMYANKRDMKTRG